jgi:hypothetical protein
MKSRYISSVSTNKGLAKLQKKRSMNKTTKARQKGKAKERPKDIQPPKNQKKGREPGSYLTHNPFNVANMQIVRSNSNGRSRTSITHQCNLPLYNRG